MSSRPSCSARRRLCRRAGAPSNNQQDGASNSMPLASCHGCHAGRQGEGIAACLCRRAGMPQLGEPCLFKFGVMLLTIQSAAGADEVQRDGCSSTVSSTGLAGRAACHTNLVHHVECVVLARMRNEALQSQVEELQTQALLVYRPIVVCALSSRNSARSGRSKAAKAHGLIAYPRGGC